MKEGERGRKQKKRGKKRRNGERKRRCGGERSKGKMLGVKRRWKKGSRERRQRAGTWGGKGKAGKGKGRKGRPWLLRITNLIFFTPLCINLLSNSQIALSDGNKSVIVTNMGPLMSTLVAFSDAANQQ